MKQLKEEFNKNDMHYVQVKRTDTVAMYRLESMESGVAAGHEVWDIPIQEASTRKFPDGRIVEIEKKERPVANEEFGMQYRSKSFVRNDLAEKYYQLLINTKPQSGNGLPDCGDSKKNYSVLPGENKPCPKPEH